MSEPSIQKLIDHIVNEWADKGKIIEGGWVAYAATSGLDAAPDLQRTEMHKAYMIGAQHLWACINGIMDADREPTAKDLRRMSLIHVELEEFRRSLGNQL